LTEDSHESSGQDQRSRIRRQEPIPHHRAKLVSSVSQFRVFSVYIMSFISV